MRRAATYLACLMLFVSLLVVSGCTPRMRVVWSADGQRAAVLGERGLYMMDATGRLTDLQIADATQAVWLHEQSSMLLVTQQPAERWQQVLALLPAKDQHRLQAAAEELMRQVLAFEGDWEAMETFIQGPQIRALREQYNLSGQELISMVLYARDEHHQAMLDKFGQPWQDVVDEVEHIAVNVVQRFDPATGERHDIVGLLNEVQSMRLSRDDQIIMLVTGSPTFDETPDPLQYASLRLVPLATVEGADPSRDMVTVAKNIAWYPDWHVDGRSIVYVQAQSTASWLPTAVIGTLVQQTVRGPDGQLSAKPVDEDDDADRRKLGAVMFDSLMRTRCLDDGSVLFAAPHVQLPATDADAMMRSWQLFRLDADQPDRVTPLLPQDFQPQPGRWISYFSVSPDQQRIALPLADGAVGTLRLADGRIDMPQPVVDTLLPADVMSRFGSYQGHGIRTVPVWRDHETLCLVMPIAADEQDADKRLHLVLHRDGHTQVLSKDWPEEVREGWLDQ